MAAEKEGKKKEKEKEEKKDEIEVITAIYKVNLHCKECGQKIKKHLVVTQGVQSVDLDMEKAEIKVKGRLDPLKILKLIEKKSKKKVELISPKVKPKQSSPTENKPKETKEPIIRTISVKVYMHCNKCERDLRNRLLRHKGIFSVKTDTKAQTLTIEGTIEQEKLISFIRKRVHKGAEIISSKEEKKDEKKEKGKEEKKDEKKEKGKEEEKKDEKKEKGKEEKKDEKKEKGKEEKKDEKKEEKKDDKKEKGKEEGETTKTIVLQEDTRVEIKIHENVPYIIHYVYAPQLFSDENPNACYIM
ncbi:hypothetical protein L6164_002693 [Bauhinia variegata]|uniref:Uncharacterized protein n=1 Tax=Bauhinia variegata TaxID=167791 RepID=A0ACB9Q4H5_BAUVA|nr:hypothetical protein L6164_002693 [Bauhinia variegata]